VTEWFCFAGGEVGTAANTSEDDGGTSGDTWCEEGGEPVVRCWYHQGDVLCRVTLSSAVRGWSGQRRCKFNPDYSPVVSFCISNYMCCFYGFVSCSKSFLKVSANNMIIIHYQIFIIEIKLESISLAKQQTQAEKWNMHILFS